MEKSRAIDQHPNQLQPENKEPRVPFLCHFSVMTERAGGALTTGLQAPPTRSFLLSHRGRSRNWTQNLANLMRTVD